MADFHSAHTKAFISYSHADDEYRERLRIHLKHYTREQNIDVWDDTRIETGAIWKDEIKRAIASAKVAILLVSADFIASDFIANDELPPLLDAAEKDGLVIFSIILSSCAFKKTKLAHYQAFNKPSEPVVGLSKDKQEKIWARLAEKVADALRHTPADEIPPPLKEEPDAFISPHEKPSVWVGTMGTSSSFNVKAEHVFKLFYRRMLMM